MNKKYQVFLSIMRIILLIFVFVPILWGLRTSFSASTHDLSIIPKEVTLDNYITILKSGGFLNAMKNSIIYACGTITLLLLIIIPAAYALSRLMFKGKKFGIILLFLPLLPAITILIPLSRIINQMGLFNTQVGVILLTTTFQIPFTCWLLRNFFQGIAVSIEEAAYVDGCTKVQSIIKIVLPNCLPGIVSVVVYSFVSTWLSYLIPYSVISVSDKFSLSQTLLFMQGQFGTDYPQLTAAALLTLLPPLIFFCIFQRWFIAGLFGFTSK